MDEKEFADLIAHLKKLDPDATAKLVAHYESRLECNEKRIAGLLKGYADAVLPKGNITPRIPKTFKPTRQGGDPAGN